MKKQFSIEDFSIRDVTEEGVKINLVDPATGETTDEWLQVRGDDSEVYRLALARYNRERLDFMREKGKSEDDEAKLKFESAAERKLIASLVADWSLKDKEGEEIPCNLESVCDLFYKAPQIKEQVDQFAGNRANFSKPPSKN